MTSQANTNYTLEQQKAIASAKARQRKEQAESAMHIPLEKLEQALRGAHEAGDVKAAQRLANAIKYRGAAETHKGTVTAKAQGKKFTFPKGTTPEQMGEAIDEYFAGTAAPLDNKKVMNVELPNGTIIEGVPNGTSKEAIKRKAINAGVAKESDFDLHAESNIDEYFAAHHQSKQKTYEVTDPETNLTLQLTGDSPPTEAELEEIFGIYNAKHKGKTSAITPSRSPTNNKLSPVPEGYELVEESPVPEGYELAQPEQQQSFIDSQLLSIPGMKPIAEMAAAANKSIFQFLDFIGPDNINAVLQLAGSEKRVPTLDGTLGSDGGYMEEGLAKDIATTTGKTLPAALGIGQALRTGASKLSSSPASESVGAGILRQLGSSKPKTDVQAATLSAVGAEVGEEQFGADGRLIGSIMTPVAGMGIAEATKTLVRGGARASREAMQQVLKDFEQFDATPTLGQATGKTFYEGVSNISSKLLGGGPIVKALDRAQSQMQKRLGDIADDLSSVKGSVETGRVIQSGISGNDGFVERFLTRSGNLWKLFDSHIDDAAKVQASHTREALDSLINDTSIGKVLNNQLVERIKGAFDDAGGAIDYRSLRQLRSTIGRRLGEKTLTSDIPRAELKQLYGAISQDLRDTAQQSGPKALQALNRANTFTASGHKRIDDFVERIVNRADLDKVFNSLAKGGEGVQAINAVRRSLKPEEWEAVAANVVRRLGRASYGQQDHTGEVFSIGRFLTDWNKLGPAKKVIFAGSDKLNNYSQNLDQIARAASRYKSSLETMANSSGTTQQAANLGTITTGAAALGTGNHMLFGSILMGVAVNNGAARLMTNPTFVRWLASMASNGTTAQLARLGAIQRAFDPETSEHALELVETLKEMGAQ